MSKNNNECVTELNHTMMLLNETISSIHNETGADCIYSASIASSLIKSITITSSEQIEILKQTKGLITDLSKMSQNNILVVEKSSFF